MQLRGGGDVDGDGLGDLMAVALATTNPETFGHLFWVSGAVLLSP